MNKSYVEEIRLCFYIACSLIVILQSDNQPVNQPTNQHVCIT
jgi:hypothetical protein